MKIDNLFSLRQLMEFGFEICQNKQKVIYFLNEFRSIQNYIYSLDKYGEDNFHLNFDQISNFWLTIYEDLIKLKYSESIIVEVLERMRSYQEIEVNMRYGRTLIDYDLYQFYKTKSCDIHIYRSLLNFEFIGSLKYNIKWEYYDIISEIYDDIMDIEEDINTYNGNRIIISIIYEGINRTFNTYKYLLENLSNRINILDNSLYVKAYYLTQSIITEFLFIKNKLEFDNKFRERITTANNVSYGIGQEVVICKISSLNQHSAI